MIQEMRELVPGLVRHSLEQQTCDCDVCAGRVSMDDAEPDNYLCSKHEEIYNLIKEHPDGRWYQ